MAVTSRHNKYTSIPDWFSGQSTETATTSSSVSQTVYISGSSGSTTTDSTVDFKDIPIDNQTIVWQNEQLTVPIDNDKIIIVDGKVTTSANANGVWELRQLTDGTNYIYTTYPVVTQLGITMYSGTEGLDIGGIYDGLPIDNTTIYWDIDSNGNKVLKAIGSSSGGGVADSVAWANVNGKPIWLLDDKISYSEIEGTPDLSNYVVKSYVDDNFVTFTLDEVITGVKSFTNGLKIGESLIKQLQEDVVYIDANLVVRGGVTMYYDDGEIDIPNIKDQIGPAGYNEKGLASFDQTYFTINDGHVSLIEDAVGLNEDELLNYLTNNKYATQSWVETRGYALNSDLTTLSTKVNDFLEGSDTDNIINKWKELEAFLTGLDGSNDLATILSWKADKTYVDETFVTIGGDTEQTITGPKNFTGGLKVNGSPIYYDTEKKYWKLEGDLLVTGGVTMYGNDSDFVASTIMDAILYDSETLGINAQGQLYVKGSVGGATTLGSLSNVGSWADSVAPQDRIMYQAANSSQWVAKNLSDLAVGGVTGDYLPLTGGQLSGTLVVGREDSGNYTEIRHERDWTKTAITSLLGTSILVNDYNGISTRLNINSDLGLFYTSSRDNHTAKYPLLHSGNYSSYALPLSGGTITNSLAVPLTINANNDGQVGLFLQSKGNNKTYVGWDSSRGTCLYEFASDSSLNILNGVPRFNTNTIWHSGNFTPSNYLPLSGGTIKSTKVPQLTLQGESTDAYITFKTTLNTADSAHSGLVNLPNIGASASFGVSDRIVFPFSGGMYYRNGYNGTNQTIWHEGNDGSGSGLDADLLDGKHYSDIINGNVASATRLQAYQHNSGENVLISGSRTDNTFPRYIYDNGWGLCLRWREGNGVVHNGIIATLNDNVASATKLQTLRTIWGQSFDGTGNVSGDIYTSSHRLLGTYGGAFLYAGIRDGEALSIEPLDSNATWLNRGITLLKNGNVGIGTANPESFKLYVNGSIYSIGSYRSAAMIHATGALRSDTGLELYQATPYIDFHFNSSTADYTTRIIEGSSGVLSLIGSLIVTGGITMYSDQRKKTILNYVELSLQQVANAPLIEHYYNSDRNKTTHVGSIAQYWAEMNDWFCKKDSEGFYTMEIQNAALASAISVARELVKFETETDKRIRLLEEENKRLKEEVEQLKWNIA